MTILEGLTKLAGNTLGLIEFLRKVGATTPDLKPTADNLIAKLEAGITPESLAALGKVIPGELLDIARGHINPRTHPGDAI